MYTSQSAIEFLKTDFDFLVLGGGNAGLPLAVRLAENPHVKVGLLEAGPLPTNDPLVTQPRLLGRASGNPSFDWGFKTSPQVHAAQRSFAIPRGKGLSGSSMINYMVWDRASKAEYNSWKYLAETEGAWDWDTLLPYFAKSENAGSTKVFPDQYPEMSLPDARISRAGIPAEEASGWAGPVKTSYNTIYTDVIAPAIKAFNSIGVPTNANPFGGETDGIKNLRRTIDQESGKRITAASAYLHLAAQFDNLHILTSATVTKLVFDPLPDALGNYVVRGAKFLVDGEEHTASVKKEVILSLGVVQTPKVLELSGIGEASLLKSLGIQCLVDLPGLGENLHDHVFVPIQFLLKPGVKTFDEFRINAEFSVQEMDTYESSGQGWAAAIDSTAVYHPLQRVAGESDFTSMLENLKKSILKAKEDNTLAPLLAEQCKIQLEWLDNNTVPNLETIIFSKGVVNTLDGRSYFIMQTGVQHPFSRGSIHITSADPLQPPKVDPNYLSNDFDVKMLVSGFRFMEKLSGKSYLTEIIEAKTVPPVPLPNDDQLTGFIRKVISSGGHLMGTAPLARRDLGGVVDNNLRCMALVTSELPMQASSPFPLPLIFKLQYMPLQRRKAADLIKADHKM